MQPEPARRLSTAQAARYLGPNIATRTLERWRWTGEGPVFIRIGRHVVYDTADLDAWLASKRRQSTSQLAASAAAAAV